MPPSDETIYQELIRRGYSPEQARIAVEDSAPKVGREPPSDETVYQELIKRGYSPEQAAIAAGETSFDTVAGPQWPVPQAPQPEPLPPPVAPEERRAQLPWELGASDRSIILAPEDEKSLTQEGMEAAWKLAGGIVGTGKAAADYLLEKPQTPSGRPTYMGGQRAYSGGRRMTAEEAAKIERPEREKSPLTQAYETARDQIERDTDYRLDKDFVSNWENNSADMTEGLIELLTDVADINDGKAEGWLEGPPRAFMEGMDLGPALLGGGAAFIRQLHKRPLDTALTHPADFLLTLLPAVPAIARKAKLGNAKAIKALQELEDRGVIRDFEGYGDLPGDAATVRKARAARVARAVIEAPGQVMGKEIKIPLLPKKNWGDVPGLKGGDVDLSFPEPAVSTKGRKPFPEDRPRSFEPSLSAPVIEKLTQTGTTLAEGSRALTVGDLIKASVGGLAIGTLLDEETIGLILAPALKVMQASAPGVTLTMFKKYLTDQAARNPPRAHALTRDSILRPQSLQSELGAIARELTDPDMLATMAPDAPRTRAPIGTKEKGTVRVEREGGGRVDWAEDALTKRAEAGLEQPLLRELSPEMESLMAKFEGVLRKGEAKTRVDAPSGAQVDLTPRHLVQIREILSGDSIPLLNDKTVRKEILARLIREGWDPKLAGDLLGRATADWDKGLNPMIRTRYERKGKKRGPTRTWEPDTVEEVPIQRYIEDAVARSPKAQKAVLERAMGIIHRQVAKDHRAKIVADTANPVFDIYRDWADKPENAGKNLNDLIRSNPEVYHEMWAKMYELEKGLVDGAPIMFIPFNDITPFKMRRQFIQGGHLNRVAEKMSDRHGIPAPVARHELAKLSDRIRQEFTQRDDLGGHLDTKTHKLFRDIDKATDFVEDIGWWAKSVTHAKKALTVLSLKTGMFQGVANLLMQSIDGGVPFSGAMKGALEDADLYRRYRGKKGVGETNARMLRSIDRTGALDTDFLKVETKPYKGERFVSKLAKPFEKFYRYGDVLAKLNESIRVYKKAMSELDMLKDGETVTLMVDSNKAVRLNRAGDELFRDGFKQSLDDVSDIVARGATMAAENKFFNYFDTGLLSTKLRGGNILGLGSLFYTWFSKALAGRRGGLVGNVMQGEFSPIVSTDSAAILSKQLADAAATSARRAVFSQAGTAEGKARREAYREVASYHGVQTPMWMPGPVDEEGIGHVKTLENVHLFGPFNMAARAVGGAIALARGDTKLENIKKLKEEIREAGDDSPEAKRRLSLAIKQLSGKGLSGREFFELVGLAGGPALDFINDGTADFKDKYGNPMTWDRAAAKFGAAILGSTLSSSLQTAWAIGKEEGFFQALPEGVKLSPEMRETAMRFAVRRIMSMSPTPRRLGSMMKSGVKVSKSGKVTTTKEKIVPGKKGAIDWYLEGMKRALEAGTSRALKRRAKKLMETAIDKNEDLADDLLDQAEDWNDIIADAVEAERDRLYGQLDADQDADQKAEPAYRPRGEAAQTLFFKAAPQREKRPGDDVVDGSLNIINIPPVTAPQ